MKKTFKCICKDHLLKIEYNNFIEWTHIKTKKKHKENIPELWVGIYEIHSEKTGRKLKRPKLLADFEVMGSDRLAKEMISLMSFLESVLLKWWTRKNK